jgi:hypothetical protein
VLKPVTGPWVVRLQSGFNACHARWPNRHTVPRTISTTPSLPAQPRTLLNPATGLLGMRGITIVVDLPRLPCVQALKCSTFSDVPRSTFNFTLVSCRNPVTCPPALRRPSSNALSCALCSMLSTLCSYRRLLPSYLLGHILRVAQVRVLVLLRNLVLDDIILSCCGLLWSAVIILASVSHQVCIEDLRPQCKSSQKAP